MMSQLLWTVCALCAAGNESQPASSAPTAERPPAITRFVLKNGLKVTIIEIENEAAFHVFTCMPGGLLADEAGHLLWTQLVERLSTQLVGLSTGFADTDHVRLESWSKTEDWQATLAEHARMLAGVDFDKEQLEMYKTDVVSSVYMTAESRRIFVAAHGVFAQAVRHGRQRVSFDREIMPAALEEVKAYRERHWGIMPGTRLCIICHVPTSDVRAEVEKLFSGLPARPTGPAAPVKLAHKNVSVEWNTDCNVLVLAWYLPALSVADQAALLVAENLLQRRWRENDTSYYSAFTWSYPMVAMLPEGPMFVVVRSLGRNASLSYELAWFLEQTQQFALEDKTYTVLPQARKAVSEHLLLTTVPRPQADPSRQDYFELWRKYRCVWATLEWRYGEQRGPIGQAARDVTRADVERVAGKYLSPQNRIVCAIVPQGQSNSLQMLRESEEGSELSVTSRAAESR